MKTSLENLAEQLAYVGSTCDAWGNDRTCPKKPRWQLELRHASPATPNCIPVTCLLCDECRDMAYKTLGPFGTGPYQCSNCQEGGLIAPVSFILREMRI